MCHENYYNELWFSSAYYDWFSLIIYFTCNRILISFRATATSPHPFYHYLKGDSNLNDNLSPWEIDWVMSEWLYEQPSPPGNDGPVTTGTKAVMSKRRKRGRRGKSQECKNRALKGPRNDKGREWGGRKDNVKRRGRNNKEWKQRIETPSDIL